MNIKRILYPVTTLGPGKRVGLWTTGCNKNCRGCMSPELKEFDAGQDIHLEDIVKAIKRIKEPIDGVTISGGEPFLQIKDLMELVVILHKHVSTDILIFTGFTLEELKDQKNSDIDKILQTISVLVDGPYIQELNDNVGLRGSSNQRIHVFSNKSKYEGAEMLTRKIQSVQFDGKLHLIGIKNSEVIDD